MNFFELVNNASELSGGEQFGVPQVCSVQRYHSNHPASSPKKSWQHSAYIPFADYSVTEFSSRFNQLSTTAVSGVSITC